MTVATSEAFYPPRITPAAKAVRFPLNVVKLLRNNLELIPEEAYRKSLVLAPGPPRVAFLTGLDVVKTMLLDRAAEFPKAALQVKVLKPLFGDAMISAEGREWRWQRGVASPQFRHDELLRYAPVMSAAAEAMVESWRVALPGVVRPIHDDMMRAAFEVISNTMLVGGAKDVLRAIEDGHAEYFAAINWWVTYCFLGLPHWLPRPRGRATYRHEQRVRHAVAELVAARRKDPSGDDILAKMLRASDPETGNAMSDRNLVDNLVAFLMAGYDTTAFTLTWTLYLVSQSPEWEARMLDGILRVAGDGPITGVHVAELTTVQQVLNESLRLYPAGPVLIREIQRDVVLDGVTVRAGTVGVIPVYAIHRHKAYWDDPDRFDPDRFGPGRPKPSRFQFLPFGAGPRICIGASFAMLEATIMLATFIRGAHFEFQGNRGPSPIGRMLLVPKDAMRMRVTVRGR